MRKRLILFGAIAIIGAIALSFIPYNINLVSISTSNTFLSTSVTHTIITTKTIGLSPRVAGASGTGTLVGNCSVGTYTGMKIVVRFFTNGTETEIYKSWNCTNSTGYFIITDIPTGYYDVGIKSDCSLSALIANQTFTDGNITNIDFGILLQGDITDDDYIDASDQGPISANWHKWGPCIGYSGNWTVCKAAVAGEPEIENAPSSKAFGTLSVNTNSTTTIDFFTLNNTGGVAVDVTIHGTNFTGGDDTWALSDTATIGENTYGLKAGLDDVDDTFDVIVKHSEAYNTLVSDLGIGADTGWGIQLFMPSTVTNYDGQEMTAVITLIASEAA